MDHFTPVVRSLAAPLCVQVLECGQSTLEEKWRGKYKGENSIYSCVLAYAYVSPESPVRRLLGDERAGARKPAEIFYSYTCSHMDIVHSL